MSTTIQEKKSEKQGPTCAFIWTEDPGDLGKITISYTGRMMPWRRASGLSSDEQAKARKGERVVIGGCPCSWGTTWRQVVYHRGRYRTRIPSPAVVKAVEVSVYDWHMNEECRRRVEEGVKTWDEFTRIKKLMQYGPQLLAELGLPTEQRDMHRYVKVAYSWDNGILGDD
jgi:hypothetical protein